MCAGNCIQSKSLVWKSVRFPFPCFTCNSYMLGETLTVSSSLAGGFVVGVFLLTVQEVWMLADKAASPPSAAVALSKSSFGLGSSPTSPRTNSGATHKVMAKSCHKCQIWAKNREASIYPDRWTSALGVSTITIHVFSRPSAATRCFAFGRWLWIGDPRYGFGCGTYDCAVTYTDFSDDGYGGDEDALVFSVSASF